MLSAAFLWVIARPLICRRECWAVRAMRTIPSPAHACDKHGCVPRMKSSLIKGVAPSLAKRYGVFGPKREARRRPKPTLARRSMEIHVIQPSGKIMLAGSVLRRDALTMFAISSSVRLSAEAANSWPRVSTNVFAMCKIRISCTRATVEDPRSLGVGH